MTQAKVYGTDHIYSVDVFNEMPPPSIKPEFMYNTSHAIFDTLQAGDPEAVWVLQGWTFIGSYWNETLVEAWLTGKSMFMLYTAFACIVIFLEYYV